MPFHYMYKFMHPIFSLFLLLLEPSGPVWFLCTSMLLYMPVAFPSLLHLQRTRRSSMAFYHSTTIPLNLFRP